MANFERDARSDDVRVFDGAEDEEDVEGSRLPLLIVIALLVLAAFGAVVWLAYQRGVAQGHSEVPHTITAQAGPARVAPDNAGGTPTPYTGLKIYQQPAPSDDEADTADSVPPPPTDVPPKPNTMAATAPVTVPTPPGATTPKPAAAMTTPPPAVTPPPVKPTPTPVKPTQTAAVTPPPPTKPAATTPPAPPPAAETPAPAVVTPAPAATGGSLLQIGSYKSEAEANAAWTAYKSKHPVVASLSSDIKMVDLGAKGTWYRLRIVGGSKALCNTLIAQGGACIPAK